MENDGESPELPVVLMMEEFTLDPELREALYRGFQEVIEREVSPPPETWGFDTNEAYLGYLERQFKALAVDRAIIAFHDLNISKARDSEEARRSIETKFEASERRVRQAELRSGRPPLKIFWSMIVYEHVKELPFVRYPSRRYERWHLLPFVRSGGNGTPAPEPSRADIFRSYLRGWLRHSDGTAG
jgi:hypothetical protein